MKKSLASALRRLASLATSRALVALAVLGLVVAPLSAGMWSDWPQVGVAAHCASTNQANTTVPTGSSSGTCTNTVPAGPTILSGSETIPGDSNLGQGQQPQQVNIGMASLNALPVSITAASITANNTLSPTALVGGYVLTGASALSPVTLYLPGNAIDGQQFVLTANQNITTLVVVGSNTGIAAGPDLVDSSPTALTKSTTAAFGYQFKYSKSAAKWYRLQ